MSIQVLMQLYNYYDYLFKYRKFTEAIDYLSKFKSDDIVLSALAKGAVGDAYPKEPTKRL
jgi:hypothetical protein